MPDPIFLPPDRFAAPGDVQFWNSVGTIAGFTQNPARPHRIDLRAAGGGPAPRITFLSKTVFRLRFNASGQYAEREPFDPDNLTDPRDPSYAVVTQDLGLPVNPVVSQPAGENAITIDTGRIQVEVSTSPYSLSVSAGGQLIHCDAPQSIKYILESVVNFKRRVVDAYYLGFGEKSGTSLDKSGASMTFFNYDNFSYGFNGGDPLYISIPLLIEAHPQPIGLKPYCYAIFLDNPSQTYFNIGGGGRNAAEYYFGAVYGDLNYYFIYGDSIKDLVGQYTQLTGRMPMPPKYVLGYHQGCYGYNVDVGGASSKALCRQDVAAVAAKYRHGFNLPGGGSVAPIPCDGLHIDVDLQHDYRTFTAGPSSFRPSVNFGNPVQLLQALHGLGFKCSTNITAMIRDDSGRDAAGNPDPYASRDQGFAPPPVFLRDPNNPSDFFKGAESYGENPAQPASSSAQHFLRSPGFYPDLTDPTAVAWWQNQYQFLVGAVGIDMIWQDMTDPALDDPWGNQSKTLPPNVTQFDYGRRQLHVKIHNAYAQTMLRATAKAMTALRPGERTFIIARGGYAGLQRYAGVWTGDSASAWTHYQMNIPLVINLGLSGVPIAGSDIGGFASGPDVTNPGLRSDEQPVVDADLFVRWMTMGAFLPWYRNHYDSYDKSFQEPFSYADPAFTKTPDTSVPYICRKYIELRYRLLQYFYDCMREAHTTGLPIARPVFLNYPAEAALFDRSVLSTQFMVGGQVLVAPQMLNGQTSRNVRLPTGPDPAKPIDWYALTLDGPLPAAQAGGGNPSVSTQLDEVPVFVPAGAIIPARDLEQYVGEKGQAPLTFVIYPGPDNTYELYQDDGHSTDYATQNAFRVTEVTSGTSQGSRRVRLLRTTDNFLPAESFYRVRWLGVAQAPQTVTVNGQPLAPVASGSVLDSQAGNAYFFDAAKGALTVKVLDNANDVAVEARFT